MSKDNELLILAFAALTGVFFIGQGLALVPQHWSPYAVGILMLLVWPARAIQNSIRAKRRKNGNHKPSDK